MVFTCSKCGAKMFKGENTGSSFCCGKGSIKLPPIKEPLNLLKNLLIGGTKHDHDFRTNIRAYNSSLAFASMCVTGKEYTFKTRGPYCYRVNGEVYHLTSQMEPKERQRPNFSQIYIYDKEHELENRLHTFKGLDKNVLKELQDMIKEVNPYAYKYIQAGDLIRERETADICLVFKTTGTDVDPHTYNLPTGTDVAVNSNRRSV